MTVGDRASLETDEIICEIDVSGIKSGYGRENGERSNSNNGVQRGSFSLQEMNNETRGRRYSIIVDDESKVILQELELENYEKNQKNDIGLPKALDGGYGWVICCGVFMNQMIFGGFGRSEGLFFLQFQSRFDTSAQLAAWPGSLQTTLHLFMGPVCGAVVNRYSVRTALMIGTIINFFGMLLSAFAPNVYFLFLSHTLLQGVGRGLMSGVLLLNLYFDKHRSLATGLGMSGNGIGSLWVVLLTQFVFDEYGFMGAFMILAAVNLHSCIFAMILRPLSMHYRFMKSKLRKRATETGRTDESIAFTGDSNGNLQKNQIYIGPKENDDVEKLSMHSDKFFINSNNEKFSDKLISAGHELIINEIKTVSETSSKSSDLPVTSQPSNNMIMSLQEGAEPLLENSLIENKVNSEKSKHSDDNCCTSSLKICFPVEFKQKGEKSKNKIAFHWNLLKSVPFMIFCIGNFLFVLAFKTAFTFLPAIAMSKGLTKQEAALVLTITGTLDTFGRIAFGFIMDLKPLRPLRPYAFNFLLFIIATASLLVPSLTTFSSFGIVCSVYGFMTGAFIAQKYVVIVDMLGREMMPSALGIQKLFQGFGSLIGPPFAGALKDVLGNYDSSFYLGGASMLGSALFLFSSTILIEIRKKKAKL